MAIGGAAQYPYGQRLAISLEALSGREGPWAEPAWSLMLRLLEGDLDAGGAYTISA